MFTNNDINSEKMDALGNLRMHCFFLDYALNACCDACGSDMPPEIISRVNELSNLLTEYISSGFIYHSYRDDKGDYIIDTLPLDK